MKKPVYARHMREMTVNVEIYNMSDDSFVMEYETNLANDKQRRVFAEQMTNTYVGGQYSVISPVKVVEK